MSAIFGGYFQDPAHEGISKVSAIGAELLHYGPDAQKLEVREGLILGENILFTSKASITQGKLDKPFCLHEFSIVADARIDYKEELKKKLDLNLLDDVSDAELILRAYLHWGKEAFSKHLYGDYAFAIWSNDAKTFILGRDPAGMRALYFWNENGNFAFSTKAATLELLLKSIEYDPLYFIQLNMYVPSTRTLLKGIEMVKAGTLVSFSKGEIYTELFYTFQNNTKGGYKDFKQHIEELQFIYNDCIKTRADSVYPVGSAFSGGLDSTGIVYSLAELFSKENKVVNTYTVYPNDKNSVQDIDFVNKAISMDPRLINHSMEVNLEKNYNDFILGIKKLGVPVLGMNGMPSIQLSRFASQEHGVRTYFEGALGELGLSSYGYEEITHLLNNGNYRSYKRKISKYKETSYFKINSFAREWFRFKRRQYEPKWLFSLVKRKDVDYPFFPEYDNVVMDYLWEYMKIDVLSGEEKRVANINQLINRFASVPSRNFMFEFAPVEIVQPNGDRRLLEYILSIPVETLIENFEPRGLARKVYGKNAPDFLLNRKEKGYFFYQSSYIKKRIESLDFKKNFYPSLVDSSKNEAKNNVYLNLVNLIADER